MTDTSQARPAANVIIMGDLFGFPHFAGSGASTRVLAYAQGLRDSGARVKVICVEPSEDRAAPVNTDVKGTYDGVDFEYTYGRTARPASGAERKLRKVAKYPRFLAAVRERAAEGGGLDAIIVYSRRVTWIFAARIACWLTGAVFLHEDVELYLVWHESNLRKRVRRWFYEEVAFMAFDGCLAISSHLQEYCAAHVRRGAQAIVIPILVDVDEFASDGDGETIVDECMTYCGSLSHPQSVSVVEVFGAIAQEFPGLHLKLIGGSNRPDAEEKLRRLAARLGVAERVDFAGRVPREELIRLLCSARVLVLPRSSEARAERAAAAALPTKLAEYLAAGRPVVVSAAGDVRLYLTDGVDAYLAPPTDAAAFADRLRFALSHPEEAEAVGRRGRETARRSFEPTVHAARILDFIAELRSGRSGPVARRWSRQRGRAAGGARG